PDRDRPVGGPAPDGCDRTETDRTGPGRMGRGGDLQPGGAIRDRAGVTSAECRQRLEWRATFRESVMATKATVVKAELQISDMDRHYYATHALTLAQHPSETDARLMVRLLAFALYADERLEFGRGLSDEEEPALSRRNYTNEVELWIDVGNPDESRIKKACARAGQVVVVNYGGRASDIWWDKVANTLRRLKNL